MVQNALIDARALLRIAEHLQLDRYIASNGYTMLSGGEATDTSLTSCRPLPDAKALSTSQHSRPCHVCKTQEALGVKRLPGGAWWTRCSLTTAGQSIYICLALIAGHKGTSVRSDVSEALIGAIYLDHGWATATAFTRHLIENVLGVGTATINSNFKVCASSTWNQ